MLKLLILIIVSIQTFLVNTQKSEKVVPGCIINIVGDDPNISPLVVDTVGNFIDPLALFDTSVSINHNAIFWIACPGGNFSSPQISVNSKGELAACDAGNSIFIQGNKVSFNSINCNLDESARPSLLRASYGETCESGGILSEIGYDFFAGVLPVYKACVTPDSTSLTFYVKYTITRWANALRGHTQCSTIKSFDDNIPSLYARNRTNQILQNLGYDDDFYLEEGQLAANTDFFYPFQRDATSCYTNVAPQWHTFKEGNWAAVQKSITTLIRQGGHGDFVAYSGTLGVANLEDRINGGLSALYLDKPKLPVPRWFWKLIYSSEALQGNIIIGYNNPYIVSKKDVDAEFLNTVCVTDQFQNTAWLTDINNADPQFGYIYVCTLGEAIDAALFEVVTKLLKTEKKDVIGNLYESPARN